MTIRTALLVVTLLCGGLAVAAPVRVDSIEVTAQTLRGKSAAAPLAMPFVRAGNAAVATRINDALFISQLGTLAPRHPGTALLAGGVNPGIEQFTVSGEEGPVLSVDFEIEGCGAYCETYHSVHNFDTANGRRINDLLTVAGKRELARRMTRERLSRFQQQAAFQRNELAAAKKKKAVSQDELEGINERLELNSECAAREADRLKDGSDFAQAYTYYTEQYAQGALVLTSERCSNHAMRALDDVGAVALHFPFASLRPYLTAYGKALLLGEGSARDTGFDRQVLYGHLNGNIAITMQLTQDPGTNNLSGVYFYDKFGKPIGLAGTRQGDVLTLTERLGEEGAEGEAAVTGATMRLVLSGSQLRGEWIGNKQFPVQLTVP